MKCKSNTIIKFGFAVLTTVVLTLYVFSNQAYAAKKASNKTTSAPLVYTSTEVMQYNAMEAAAWQQGYGSPYWTTLLQLGQKFDDFRPIPTGETVALLNYYPMGDIVTIGSPTHDIIGPVYDGGTLIVPRGISVAEFNEVRKFGSGHQYSSYSNWLRECEPIRPKLYVNDDQIDIGGTYIQPNQEILNTPGIYNHYRVCILHFPNMPQKSYIFREKLIIQ